MGREERARTAAEQAQAEEYEARIEALMGDTPQPHDAHGAGCPKCGHDTFGTLWCAGAGLQGTNPTNGCRRVGEHLHRKCGACSFLWWERCADDPENPKAAPKGALLEFAEACIAFDGRMEELDDRGLEHVIAECGRIASAARKLLGVPDPGSLRVAPRP